MRIKITIPTTRRDPWSGYNEQWGQTFTLSIQQAESLVADINAQLPPAIVAARIAKDMEVADLERRLAALKKETA